jgi:hypothetical protein
MILENDALTPLALIGFIGGFGPTLAAIIIQWIDDSAKVRPLLKRILRFKASWIIVVSIILVPIILYSVSYFISISSFHGDMEFKLSGISNSWKWVLLALPFGPIMEELGWRGYMLPKLLKKNGVIKSTLLVGLAWGIWHMASFTFPGAAIPSFLPVNLWTIILFCLNTIGLSMIYTYVFFKTGGSVFYAILLHAFFNSAANITADMFGETEQYSVLLSAYVINFVLAGIIGFVLIKNHEYKSNRV